MGPLEVVAVFVGAPLAIFLLIAAMVYGASARRAVRYRPDKPFRFAPVWFLSAVEPSAAGAHGAAATSAVPELAAGQSDESGHRAPRKGGTSGSW